MNILLRTQNVTKKYDGHAVLNNISLDLHEGEIVSLLGANGAGKTTLSSIIASLLPATCGDIEYRGTSIYKNLITFRKNLGFCPQKPNFADELTVREHLWFAGKFFSLSTFEIKKRVAELLEKLNLSMYADKSPAILSGGYKQRLLIARSLIHKPSLLILDEPTVALDPHIRRQLWDIIKELKNDGVTILLTTHYLDEAEVLSDRVCVMDKGKITLIDSPANLLSSFNKSKLEDVFLQLMHEEAANDTLK